MTFTRAEIGALLELHGLRPSRALGQNFVTDANTVRRIVRLAGIEPGRRVVEVGAGLGSLTLALLESGAEVTAIEVDRHLVPVLRAQVEPKGAHVVEADALRLSWSEILGTDTAGAGPDGAGPVEVGPDDRHPWVLVANLPYNVAVPVVIRVLEEAPQVQTLVVMVQREVGERLAGHVGDEAYGAVSVKTAYWADARVVGRVPPSVFLPRPKVESAIVRMDRHPAPLVDPGIVPYDRLFSLVRAGFAHRRKMLRRALAGYVSPEAYASAGIRPEARAEELTVEEWGRLAVAADGHPVLGQAGRS